MIRGADLSPTAGSNNSCGEITQHKVNMVSTTCLLEKFDDLVSQEPEMSAGGRLAFSWVSLSKASAPTKHMLKQVASRGSRSKDNRLRSSLLGKPRLSIS